MGVGLNNREERMVDPAQRGKAATGNGDWLSTACILCALKRTYSV